MLSLEATPAPNSTGLCEDFVFTIYGPLPAKAHIFGGFQRGFGLSIAQNHLGRSFDDKKTLYDEGD